MSRMFGQRISEAILARGWVGHLPEPVREALEGVTRDPIELQQYSDYLFNRGASPKPTAVQSSSRPPPSASAP